MTSIAADARLANESDARRELLSRLERALQPLEDEIRDSDLTELMADALAQDPRDSDFACEPLQREVRWRIIARRLPHVDA